MSTLAPLEARERCAEAVSGVVIEAIREKVMTNRVSFIILGNRKAGTVRILSSFANPTYSRQPEYLSEISRRKRAAKARASRLSRSSLAD